MPCHRVTLCWLSVHAFSMLKEAGVGVIQLDCYVMTTLQTAMASRTCKLLQDPPESLLNIWVGGQQVPASHAYGPLFDHSTRPSLGQAQGLGGFFGGADVAGNMRMGYHHGSAADQVKAVKAAPGIR